jgi:hypothetical protein
MAVGEVGRVVRMTVVRMAVMGGVVGRGGGGCVVVVRMVWLHAEQRGDSAAGGPVGGKG